MDTKIAFLQEDEFPAYANLYLRLVNDSEELIAQLDNSQQLVYELIQDLYDPQWDFSYQKGKWTIKEVLIHIIDTERIFGYRALSMARQDKTELPGFDQDLYVNAAAVANRSIENIKDEYMAVRQSTLTLFNSFTDEVLLRRGKASGHQVSVRAIGYLILGHELHHLNIIKERYLPKLI